MNRTEELQLHLTFKLEPIKYLTHKKYERILKVEICAKKANMLSVKGLNLRFQKGQNQVMSNQKCFKRTN